MNKGLVLSALLHIFTVLFFWVGFPFFKKTNLDDIDPINVDLVVIDDFTSIPFSEPEPEPEPETEPEPEPDEKFELGSLESFSSEIPPPPDLNKDQIDDSVDLNKIAMPIRKPVPPKRDKFDELISLVKDLENEVSRRDNSENQSELTDKSNTDFSFDETDMATLSERDAIRAHIENCWRIDPGKEGLDNLSVMLRVSISPNGSVRQAIIEDTAQYFSDPNFRTFANSVRNSVLSCKNVPISSKRYNLFKEIVFTFTPKARLN